MVSLITIGFLVVCAHVVQCSDVRYQAVNYMKTREAFGTGINGPRSPIREEINLFECGKNSVQNGCNGFSISDKTSGMFQCTCEVNLNHLPNTWWNIYNGGCHSLTHLTPFVRRQDGSVDFEKAWAEYQAGFGDPLGEFWLGLDTMHTLTSANNYSLVVAMENWSGDEFCSVYSSFSVGPASDKYRLSISGYMDDLSNAGNSMDNPALGNQAMLDGMQFSTIDQDNDNWGSSCSQWYGGHGGWWFYDCSFGDATGTWFSSGITDSNGVNWYTVYNGHYCMKKMTMSLKRNM